MDEKQKQIISEAVKRSWLPGGARYEANRKKRMAKNGTATVPTKAATVSARAMAPVQRQSVASTRAITISLDDLEATVLINGRVNPRLNPWPTKVVSVPPGWTIDSVVIKEND